MKKFFIRVNGIPYDVEVEELPNESEKSMQTSKVLKTDSPRLAAASASSIPCPAASVPQTGKLSPEGGGSILSPMPGTVLKVNVSVGDIVKKGQVLLILEAMKMENEIVAPEGGRVSVVNAEKGKAVGVGDVLVSIA